MAKKKKFVYFFGESRTEGNANMKRILGGKGANLAEMARIGLPVPPGFTISAEVCDFFYKNNHKYPAGLMAEIKQNLVLLEKIMGKKFGDPEDPLLVSVRSGAAASMPGMMDTILNLGLTTKSLKGLVKKTGNERFAYDAYRRFISMFGDVVMGVPHEEFEDAMQRKKNQVGAKIDMDLSAEDLKDLVKSYLAIYKEYTREAFPDDPIVQLERSIEAVFRSWNTPRAVIYRKINNIKGLLGTAVNVQAMVFGNMGENSGTGVAFTRDPASGAKKFYGEYLLNAQGEDVVAGIRTPEPISKLEKEMPKIYKELIAIKDKLEKHYKDMQDIEFTIQDGKLWMLQTRTGKRTIFSALRTAVEMTEEKLIDTQTAIMRVPADQLNQLFSPVLGSKSKKEAQARGDLVARGLPASPGGASGRIVFSADRAEEIVEKAKFEASKLHYLKRDDYMKDHGRVILCRIETTPEDIGGMAVAQGILTARGGMTSHAAVVARGMGVPCVAGAEKLEIDYDKKTMSICGLNKVFKEGDYISIDGFAGEVYAGEIEVKPSEILQVLNGTMKSSQSLLYRQYDKFMGWVDKIRRLGVRTNADTPNDTRMALLFGAEGIGLCRTEHMFFGGDRVSSFRRLILVAEEVKTLRDMLKDAESRRDKVKINEIKKQLKAPETQYNKALDELLPLQRGDFEGIFIELKGKPATIRTLDPPLHEFLPHDEKGQAEMAKKMNVPIEKIKKAVFSLHEFNPMLGHRGCRLGITYPEITEMQVRAIMEAAVNVYKKGIKVKPEIMIPLVGEIKELILQKEIVIRVAEEILAKNKLSKKEIPYLVGTMIEVPRAAVTSDEIAKEAEFFSFGTNDLTQMGCGFSRDDAGKFLPEYVKLGIYEKDPFQTLDMSGIGKLVDMSCKLGRKTNPKIKLGICGEHGGDPDSVRFCHKIGLTYVSCSPYRVPIARLSAAQAVIEEKTKKQIITKE